MVQLSKKLSLRASTAAVLLAVVGFTGVTSGVALADSLQTASEGRLLAPGPAAVAAAGTHSSLADMVQAVGASVVQIQVKAEESVQRTAPHHKARTICAEGWENYSASSSRTLPSNGLLPAARSAPVSSSMHRALC